MAIVAKMTVSPEPVCLLKRSKVADLNFFKINLLTAWYQVHRDISLACYLIKSCKALRNDLNNKQLETF